MTKANRVHSTPRRTAPKIEAKKTVEQHALSEDDGEERGERSEIIEQCVVYAQSIAAYNAGFKVDHTGDMDNAGAQALGGPQLRKARRALHKLVALSPAFTNGKPPLSPQEGWKRTELSRWKTSSAPTSASSHLRSKTIFDRPPRKPDNEGAGSGPPAKR
jgi:hypothetical protein